MVATTGMGEDALYRTSSPIDPTHQRNRYADNALKVTDVDPAAYPLRPDCLPEGSLHLYDLYFFWNNLRENINVRMKAYQQRSR